MARGKLIEDIKCTVAHHSQTLTAATAGTTPTFGLVCDTQGYRDLKIILNVGTIPGAAAAGAPTLSAALFHSMTNDPTTACAVTQGAFTDIIGSSTDNRVHLGHSQGHMRYVWLRLQAYAPGSPTVPIGSVFEIGRSNKDPSSDTVIFDCSEL